MRRPTIEATPRLDLRDVYRELGFSATNIPEGKNIRYAINSKGLCVFLGNGDKPGTLDLVTPEATYHLQAKALPTIQGRGVRAAVTCPGCNRWVEVLTFHQGKAGCRVCQGLIHQSTRDPHRLSRVRDRLFRFWERY